MLPHRSKPYAKIDIIYAKQLIILIKKRPRSKRRRLEVVTKLTLYLQAIFLAS
jgi:hypothetical protein